LSTICGAVFPISSCALTFCRRVVKEHGTADGCVTGARGIHRLCQQGLDANLLLNGKVLAAGGKIRVRFKRDANSETRDFNLVNDEGLSVTFDHVKLAGVDTVTLKNFNGKITAEIE
jgi:hypothetical protein